MSEYRISRYFTFSVAIPASLFLLGCVSNKASLRPHSSGEEQDRGSLQEKRERAFFQVVEGAQFVHESKSNFPFRSCLTLSRENGRCRLTSKTIFKAEPLLTDLLGRCEYKPLAEDPERFGVELVASRILRFKGSGLDLTDRAPDLANREERHLVRTPLFSESLKEPLPARAGDLLVETNSYRVRRVASCSHDDALR